MSDVDKGKHAKVIDIDGLSKPYNSTLINILESVKEETTPDKADEPTHHGGRSGEWTNSEKPPLHTSS